MAHDTWTRVILYNLSDVITEWKKERLGMIFNIMYFNECDKKVLFVLNILDFTHIFAEEKYQIIL